MALSPDQEIVIRTWVGDVPTTSELEDLYTILGKWDDVVRATLRRKIALLTEEPTSLTVPGLSVSNSQQIIALQDLLKKFDNSGGTGLDDESTMGVITGRLVRENNVR